MKICDYCGKVNEEMMSFCAGCGTSLDVPEKNPSKKNLPRTLNAKTATIIFLAYVFAQIFWGIFTNNIIGMVLSLLFGGIVMVAASYILIPKYLKDTSPTGAAWVLGSWNAILKGLLIGLVIGACDQTFILIAKHYVAYKNLDPVNQMAFRRGWSQLIFVVMAVFLAPPLEEMLFRGIFYGGYRKSFGPIWAGIFTTFVFVAIHLPEYVDFPSNAIAITVAALAMLWCRLHWKAIGPAIAVHAGYNFVLATFVICWTWWHRR